MRTTVIAIVVLGLFSGKGVLAAEMPALAKKYECDGCHTIDRKLVGPSWIEVARKYRGVARYAYEGREYGLVDGLVMKVSQGGSGNWGAMPMPPNDPKGQNKADMKKLVRFVLDLEE